MAGVIVTDTTGDPLGVTGAHPEGELLQDTEAEEAGQGVLCQGAQFATVTAVIAAVLSAAVLLSRHLDSVNPHVLRGRGHLLATGAHQYQGPHSTRNHLSRQTKTGRGQGHLLEAPLRRGAWSRMETVLLTRARGKDVF